MCLTARQEVVVDKIFDSLRKEGYQVERTEVKFCNGPRPAWKIDRGKNTILTVSDTETKVRQHLHGASKVAVKDGEVSSIVSLLGRGKFVSIEDVYFFEVTDEASPINHKLFRIMTPQPVGARFIAPIELDPEMRRELAQDLGFR